MGTKRMWAFHFLSRHAGGAITKRLIVLKLLWYHCPTGICIFMLCYVYQHRNFKAQSGRLSRKQWDLWRAALLVNQDESMLRDLDRAGEAAMFARALVMSRASERLTLGLAFSPLYCGVLDISAKAIMWGLNEVCANLTLLMASLGVWSLQLCARQQCEFTRQPCQ